MSASSNLEQFTASLREFIRISQRGAPALADMMAAGSREPGETEFGKLALELFSLQFELNQDYRTLCEAWGASPRTVRHWTQIPAVPTSAFKELELSCLLAAERSVVFHSSGTTAQQPSRHFHNSRSLQLYEASLLPWFEMNVLGPSAARRPFVCLTPNAECAPHSSLVHMFETVVREFGSEASAFLGKLDEQGCWALDFKATCEHLQKLECASSPILVLGTAFSFVHLLDWVTASRIGFTLPSGSRVMETGGYKGRSRSMPKPELHRLISELFGIPLNSVICEYGMSELSSQAYDTTNNSGRFLRSFRFPPWARAQIISPETGREVAEGEAGLVRVFDLANAFSVMVVQTEDLAIRRGNSFELLGRAVQAEPRGCSLMSTG
jgi:hypothetical protein